MLPTLLSVLLVVGAAAQAGPPIETVPFGLFSPSDMAWTFGASFSPDGKTVYFTKSEPSLGGTTIFVSHNTNGHWTAPAVAPFSGQYADSDPDVTPDGGAVIFASQRPPLGSNGTSALYEAFVRGPRAGHTVPLPNDANSLGAESSPSVARNGTLYFIVDQRGTRRIYRVTAASERSSPAYLIPLPGDGAGVTEYDVTTDPAQRFLVFSSNRSGGLGAFDLYVSVQRGYRFCAPERLPPPVNTVATEVAPSLARDGSVLYFASNRSDFVQPAGQPLDASAFQAQLAHYEDGSLRMYRVVLGAWLDHVTAGASC